MNETDFPTPRDLEQLSQLGISKAEIRRQLTLFRNPPPPVHLVRPCRPGDGIAQIPEEQQASYVEQWRSMSGRRRLAKFVPASGAATRMFKDLTAPTDPAGSAASNGSRRLLETLPNFAFYEALRRSLESQGLDLETLVLQDQAEPILRSLLEAEGLGYGSAPKGLILFHRYPSGSCSALEEQLWEGFGYLTLSGGPSRFHFTVTDRQGEAFRDQIERVREVFESQTDVDLRVEFSTQSPASDTLAVDVDNRPRRQSDGRLLLRPAGHGALLDNLQEVDADVVFVKNIDNVSHRRLHPVSIHWKRVLAGYFTQIQEQSFELLSSLEAQPESHETVEDALQFLQGSLAVRAPVEVLDSTSQTRREYVLSRLDRPLRVCGMVRNEGEPGGGPFWLPDESGGVAGQIVEAAQVDLTSPDQAETWRSSTHFNPVDLVCGLLDWRGRRFRLADFVDPTTSFVAEKSHAGHPIKALERPGLWNGSMARWNTAFVEVPLETFTPVKTVYDLLRPEHQP